MVVICSAVACVAVLAAAPAALGAEYGIAASPSTATFSPNDLTVAPGDKVTIAYAGGPLAHNSHYDDQLMSCPPTTTTSAWSCSRTFDALGDYTFHCDLHTTMTGTVHVVNPSSGSPPAGDPPPAETQPGSETPAPDVTSPAIVLGGATAQRVLPQRAVVVRVRTSEAATLTATGTVHVPPPARVFRLRRVTSTSAPNAVVTLRLRLSRRARAAVKGALASGRKLSAAIRVTATDAAGNRSVSSRRVRLRR